AGEAEQNRNADREPIEDLDDRRRDEPFPLEQVAKIEHGFLLPTQGAPPMTSSRSRLRAPCKPRSLRSELAASTHKHCTAASRWSIEGSPTSVVNAGLIGAHARMSRCRPVDLTAGGV